MPYNLLHGIFLWFQINPQVRILTSLHYIPGTRSPQANLQMVHQELYLPQELQLPGRKPSHIHHKHTFS